MTIEQIIVIAVVQGITYTLRGSEIWLKEDKGMVKHDQDATAEQAQVQGILSGMVGGVTIVPDS